MALKGLDNVKRALTKSVDDINDTLRAQFYQGLSNIAGGTPEDEGRARSNWFLKVGSPSNETTTQTNGDPHLDRMPQNVIGVRLYYANNMPYINKLEYGGYNDGPKTLSGYSDQAVGGWVRGELLRMRAGIRNI